MKTYQLQDIPDGTRFTVVNGDKYFPQRYTKVGYSYYDNTIACFSALYGGTMVHLNKELLVQVTLQN